MPCSREIVKMDVEGKIVARHQSGFVTKECRTARRARGTFVPPYDRQTPRRSPCLCKKRRYQDEQDSRVQPGSAVTTPVRAALRKSVSATPVDVLESVVRMSPVYSHLKATQTKAVSNNKLTDYAIITRSTMIDDECIGPRDAVRFMDSPPAKRLKMASGKTVDMLQRQADKLRDDIEKLSERIKELDEEAKVLRQKLHECEKAEPDAIVLSLRNESAAILNMSAAIWNAIVSKENQITAKEKEIDEILKGMTGVEYHVAQVPTDASISSLALSSGPVDKLCTNVPIYAHWFGIEMYRAYEAANADVSNNVDPIKMTLDDVVYEVSQESLKQVVTATKVATMLNRDTQKYASSRGLGGCPELRSCELTFTSLYARALDRFLFPNDKTGACLHQFPCRRKRSSHPEVTDLYIVPFDQNCRPGDPVLLSDMKLESREKAVRESLLYSAAGVEEGTGVNFPVMIGIPTTTDITELQLHVSVHGKVWKLVITDARPYDGALLCTLKAGIEHLIKHGSLVQSTPLICLTPFKKMQDYDTLGVRGLTFHHKHSNTVVKFYDMAILAEGNIKINLNAMRTLVKDVKPLEEMKLMPEHDASNLYKLSYKYVENVDGPLTLRSFSGIVSTLCKLHEHNLVHGDIRFANMVFGAEKSFLIDFDFVGVNDFDCYPSEYNVELSERHPGAVARGKMMFIHDRHSLKCIIEERVSGLADTHILTDLVDSQLTLHQLRHYFTDN